LGSCDCQFAPTHVGGNGLENSLVKLKKLAAGKTQGELKWLVRPVQGKTALPSW